MAETRSASCYLIVKRAQWWYGPPVIVGMRKEKPALKSGEVAVKINLIIPMEMFNEFIPTIDVELERPEQMLAPEAELEEFNDD